MIAVKRLTVIKAVFIATLVSAGLVMGIQPAIANNDLTCDNGFGAKVPVLMVHGFGGDPGLWSKPSSSTSFEKVLRSISNIYVARPFDYSKDNTHWVTNPNIGPKLAATIDCLSQASLKGHGKGKVVLVGHSMGVLAIQFAANQTVAGRKVADEIGHVVAIAAPSLGSGYSNVCQAFSAIDRRCDAPAAKALAYGSKELHDLPPFPANVPVRTIAGHATYVGHILFAQIKVDLLGDKTVFVTSAAHSHTEKGNGDGSKVYDCETSEVFPTDNDASCTHAALVSADYVQADVKKSIQAYLTSTTLPITNLYGLGLHLGPEWKVQEETTSSGVRDATDSSHCSSPDDCATFSVFGPTFLDVGPWKEVLSDLPECSAGLQASTGHITEKGTRLVGGRTATYYEADLCAEGSPRETIHLWKLDQPNVLITTLTGYGHDVTNMDELLQGASW